MNTQVEKSSREEQTRAVEREIEINPPVGMVWKTLTDAEELARWFPANARVTPGAEARIATGYYLESRGGGR